VCIFAPLCIDNVRRHCADSIEANIVHTEENTRQGTVELRKASSYQKATRSKLCFLLLCIVVLGGAIAVVIYILK
jgi:t-SNARE complex subunit (syntaxin)